MKSMLHAFQRPFRPFIQAWQDYLLGRLIRRHEISVMRITEWWGDGDKWSSCDQRMSEDYGHNGKFGGGETPLEAVKSILPPQNDRRASFASRTAATTAAPPALR